MDSSRLVVERRRSLTDIRTFLVMGMAGRLATARLTVAVALVMLSWRQESFRGVLLSGVALWGTFCGRGLHEEAWARLRWFCEPEDGWSAAVPAGVGVSGEVRFGWRPTVTYPGVGGARPLGWRTGGVHFCAVLVNSGGGWWVAGVRPLGPPPGVHPPG